MFLSFFDCKNAFLHRSGAGVSRLAGAALLTAATCSVSLANDAAKKMPEEIQNENPLHFLVSLDEQRIDVYRGTDLVKTSPISSGKRGNSTPTGVFSILEKRRRHFSNLYDNAPMPFMQRLTWSGIALHQGKLPGYPASHGCIRLPRSFAKSIFGMTARGNHVVVTRALAAPTLINHGALPQPQLPSTKVASLSAQNIAMDPALRGAIQPTVLENPMPKALPENPHFDEPLRMIISPLKAPSKIKTLQRLLNEMGYNAGPVDGIFGRKTRTAISIYQEDKELPQSGKVTESLIVKIYRDAGYEEPRNAMLRVRRKFRDVYSAPVSISGSLEDIGTHVFTALDFEQGDTKVNWMSVSAEGKRGGTSVDILDRLDIPQKVAADVGKLLTPGTSLTVTDRSFKRNTGLGTDFVVITR